MRRASLFQFRCRGLNPPVDRGVIDTEPTFQHDLFKVSVAERIAKIPANTQENDVRLEVTPLKRILAVMAHEGDFFRSFLSTLADQLCICNTARATSFGPMASYVASASPQFNEQAFQTFLRDAWGWQEHRATAVKGERRRLLIHHRSV
jgi:hypothetical protein